METIVASAILAIINGAIDIWKNHSGKPQDWKPTSQDYVDLQALVDAATPEAVKAAAAARLGVVWPPPPPPVEAPPTPAPSPVV